MPVGMGHNGFQRPPQPIALGERGDLPEQPPFVPVFIHQPREQVEIGAHRATRTRVQIDAGSQGGAMRDDHAHAMIKRAAKTQRVPKFLPHRACDGPFIPAVDEQRQVKAHHRFIRYVAAG